MVNKWSKNHIKLGKYDTNYTAAIITSNKRVSTHCLG